MLVWADLRVRLAPPGEAEEAKREALHVLDEAESLLGPSPSLDRERRSYARELGLAGPSADPVVAPRTAWEHYDLGRSYLRSGDLEHASEAFRSGLELRPQDFWLNFYQGLCAYRLRRFGEAVQAFRVCIALSPEAAECYYNRALAYQALGQLDQARRDYTRALALNPGMTDAALNRGIVAFQQGHLDQAVSDLERARASASSPAALRDIDYNRALVELSRGKRSLALARLRTAAEGGHKGAIELYERLRREHRK